MAQGTSRLDGEVEVAVAGSFRNPFLTSARPAYMAAPGGAATGGGSVAGNHPSTAGRRVRVAGLGAEGGLLLAATQLRREPRARNA